MGKDLAFFGDAKASVAVTLNGAHFVPVKIGGRVQDHVANCEDVSGGYYRDTLVGDGHANTLDGGSGNDRLFGKGGADILEGDDGQDRLVGGAGHDAFHFWSSPGGANRDHIVDFVHGVDKIWLDTYTFGSLQTGTLGSHLHFGAAAADGDDYVIYDHKTGKLYYDADGNGAAHQQLIAILDNDANLSMSDFLVR